MSSIFKLTKGYVEKPKRNSYDLSFQNNFSLNFGDLIPVFCKEVNPGDSMSIQASFGLRAQPLVYPVQTRMRADLNFFYVRNRTLQDDWMDFYGNLDKTIEHPYIEQRPDVFKTGSIYDYLGVPTTIMDGSAYEVPLTANPTNVQLRQFSGSSVLPNILSDILISRFSTGSSKHDKLSTLSRNSISYSNSVRLSNVGTTLSQHITFGTEGASQGDVYQFQLFGFMSLGTGVNYTVDNLTFKLPNANFRSFSVDGSDVSVRVYRLDGDLDSISLNRITTQLKWLNSVDYSFTLQNDSDLGWIIVPDSSFVAAINSLSNTVSTDVSLLFGLYDSKGSALSEVLELEYDAYLPSNYNGFGNVIYFTNIADRILDASELSELPWTGTNKKIRLNALPYRAYEAIFNSFYRHNYETVMPFRINGKAEYNKYVTNRGNGADSTPYKIYKRNWELDMFTSCVPSPQQGDAPLVGVHINNKDSSADLVFQSQELADLGVPNGEVKATVQMTDDGSLTGISYYDPELPESTLQRLMNSINAGISINDFRNTNAFQRWLEKNIRRGYRYKDQIMSHWGVDIDFNDLLMPEYIGGTSDDVTVRTIYQTASNESGVLGELGGQAGLNGKTRHAIRKYCDEAGFIIGIISVVPIPVYSQVPASYAFKSELLDYYFPEFGKIGMQPVFNYELTPLQSNDLHGVFGYQRPYANLISAIDEAHGEFRTTANSYLVHRQFADAPVLNENFLQVDNDAINDVFVITDENLSNQFHGAIWFDVKKKTSIPLHGTPALEPQN